MNASRCFDCLDDFSPEAPRFMVLKKMRDIEPSQDGSEPASFFHYAQFDPVLICEGCAGWYGDDALAWSGAGDGMAPCRDSAVDPVLRIVAPGATRDA